MVRIIGPAARRRRALIATAAAAAMILTVGIVAASAASLPGSNFEIDTDANLTVQGGATALDWANVTQVRKADEPSGAQDDSFGNGTKEDTPVPSVIDGSIPPQKSDLLNFGLYLETNANGRFLNLYWHRVQEPNGTTNMDFEFNQSETTSANGVTPVRTAGDVLVQYDLSQGGTNPTLWLSRWVTTGAGSQCQANNATPCWGTRVNLSASGDAIGSINTSPITAANADSPSLGAISARTFGEASLDFDALGGGAGTCTTFGSAYLKSRSSDSFTAAVKDFVAPTATGITNCGTVNIHKQNDVGTALAGAEFTLYNDNGTIGGTRDTVVDTVTNPVLKCTTAANGNCSITNVPFGNYWAVETVTPANHDSAPDQAFSLTQATPQQTISLTFVNPRQLGAIKVTKVVKVPDAEGNQPMAGVSIVVNGVTKVTDANGQVCFDGLLFASYTVTENPVATGYHAGTGQGGSVTVDNKASCADTTYVGETHTIHNIPLTDLTVSVSPQVAGATKSTITCDQAPTPADATPNAFDDTSETVVGLEPGTYTCTVIIDP